MNYRDRLAPIMLSAENPVTQFVIDPLLSFSFFLQVSDYVFPGVAAGLSIVFARVNHCTFIVSRLVVRCIISTYPYDRQAILLSTLPVAFVMCRDRHNSPGTVAP